jgi:Mg2+-importing ATPase
VLVLTRQRPDAQTPTSLVAYWAISPETIMARLRTTTSGLTSAEASSRLARLRLRRHHRHGVASWLRLLIGQFSSPIVLILVVATVISMLLGDFADGAIIIGIILLSGLLGFWQEHRANVHVAELLSSVQVVVALRRDGIEAKVPITDIVPGDVVLLRAGDVVAGDCRLLESEELLVDESVLTGESFPVEKQADDVLTATANLAARTTAVHSGTHVISGTGAAVVVSAGSDTQLGTLAAQLDRGRVTTAFTRGTTRFGFLLVRLMLILSSFILVVNWLLGRDFIESLLFALALAVGITPQMLPAIVSLSLSTGARRLAKNNVIVKRLEAIEDLGSLSVLCTDKTGTLTSGTPRLDRALNCSGAESDYVLELASLNAALQSGFDNPIDKAVLVRQAAPPATLFDELPYDFTRRRISVLVERDDTPLLITKGSFDGMLAICSTAQVDGEPHALSEVLATVTELYETLSAEGFRVLAVATRAMAPGVTTVTRDDESGLCLVGLLAFHDPAKDGVADAIKTLAEEGVSVRLVTGDNPLAAAAVAASVGLEPVTMLTGSEIDQLGDAALAATVDRVNVFAAVEPLHKRRIVLAYRKVKSSAVGFLGDGINDAAALQAADIGISVDTAVDVAKQAAAVVLLDKELTTVLDGVQLGRATFVNTLKYVRVTTSANFGNMLSMALASLILPFLPLLPRQILLLNFLSDFPALAIAGDAVDPEQVARPGLGPEGHPQLHDPLRVGVHCVRPSDLRAAAVGIRR